MGTDVHIHIEHRSSKTKRYKYGGMIFCKRNYHVFDIMSGEEEQDKRDSLFPVRGLPGDVTQATLKDYRDWGGDAHHASWLSTIEFAACIVEAYNRMNSFEELLWYKQYKELYYLLKVIYYKGEKHEEDSLWSYKELLKLMLSYEKDKEECRIVFWFDN